MSELHAISMEYLNLKTRAVSTRHAWRGSDGQVRLSRLRDAENTRLLALKTPAGERLPVRPTTRLEQGRLERVIEHILEGQSGPARNLLGCPI